MAYRGARHAMKTRSAASSRVLAALLLCAASAAWAQEMEPDSMLFPYAKQGPFVIMPARIVSSPVYQVGYLAGIFACLPASLIQDARSGGDVPRDKEASVVCGRGLGLLIGWPVYAASGLPFYLLKQIFWDGPRALAGLFKAPAALPAAEPALR